MAQQALVKLAGERWFDSILSHCKKHETMKTSDIHIKKVHPDCPFAKKQIDGFRAMQYAVASANNLIAYPSWYVGYQNRQI